MIVELIHTYPRISIILISILVSLFITIVNYFVLDKERLHELKNKQKDLNAQIKAHTDPQKKMELSGELMKHSMESMRHSFKPMLITMVPILIVFWFIRSVFADTTLGGGWFWYYLITAIVASIIFKKLFKLP